MIEDAEFRDLFQADSHEHIQKIEAGILELEKNPKDADLLKGIFREAHSMKGAAGLLGLKEIESITHVLEDQLGKASKGYAEYRPEDADRIYYALDQLRLLVDEACTGSKANVDLKKTIDILNGTVSINGEPVPAHDSNEKDPSRESNTPAQGKPGTISAPSLPARTDATTTVKPRESSPRPASQAPEKKVEAPKSSNTPGPGGKFKIDTMRVDPAKLDSLLGYSGELTVTKNRIQKRAQEIMELNLMFEDFTKLWKGLSGIGKEEKRKWDNLVQRLSGLKVKSIQDSAKLDLIAGKIEEGIQNVRLLPLSSVFDIFPRTVRDISRELSKEVYLTLEGGQVTADKLVIEELKDPLMHLVRNSLDHGIETRDDREKAGKPNPARVTISGKMINNAVFIEIEDDGRGLDLKRIKEKAIQKGLFQPHEIEEMTEHQVKEIIFHPGFSTKTEVTSLSGRGVGMDVVKTFVEKFKGSIEIDTALGSGTKFSIRLPTNFSTNHVLIIQLQGWKYGIPTEFVDQSLFIRRDQITTVEGKPVISWGNEPIRLVHLADYFPIRFPKDEAKSNKKQESCLILRYNGEKVGVLVDSIVDKQEILLKPFGGIIESVPKLAGTTILESGEICYMIQVSELYSEIKGKLIVREWKNESGDSKTDKKILVVEDSLITRAQIQRILEENGYQVITAVDGVDGLEKVQKNEINLLLTDIEMPKKDGFALVKEVRAMSKFRDLPIVVVTSLGSDDHIRMGKEAGANSYLIKSQFDQNVLLQTVERLLSST